jgi:hypothetical protein
VRTRPLTLIAVGLVLVAVDLRVVAVDALPDVLGWALVGLGAWSLRLRLPAVLGAVAAVASALDLVAPAHREALDPLTGAVVPHPAPGTAYDEILVFDRLHDLRLLLAIAAMVAGGWAAAQLVAAMRDRARAAGDGASARALSLLRWLVPLVWVVPYVGVAVGQGIGGDGFDPVWNGNLELVAVAGIGVVGALAWIFATTSNRGWAAQAAGDAVAGADVRGRRLWPST